MRRAGFRGLQRDIGGDGGEDEVRFGKQLRECGEARGRAARACRELLAPAGSVEQQVVGEHLGAAIAQRRREMSRHFAESNEADCGQRTSSIQAPSFPRRRESFIARRARFVHGKSIMTSVPRALTVMDPKLSTTTTYNYDGVGDLA